MYAQQGDVILSMIESLPAQAKELKTDLVHKGDNHHHRIRGQYQIFEHEEKMLILCDQQCELYHEEHKTIQMPEGLYQKSIVMEYDHFLEESRQVID